MTDGTGNIDFSRNVPTVCVGLGRFGQQACQAFQESLGRAGREIPLRIGQDPTTDELLNLLRDVSDIRQVDPRRPVLWRQPNIQFLFGLTEVVPEQLKRLCRVVREDFLENGLEGRIGGFQYTGRVAPWPAAAKRQELAQQLRSISELDYIVQVGDTNAAGQRINRIEDAAQLVGTGAFHWFTKACLRERTWPDFREPQDPTLCMTLGIIRLRVGQENLLSLASRLCAERALRHLNRTESESQPTRPVTADGEQHTLTLGKLKAEVQQLWRRGASFPFLLDWLEQRSGQLRAFEDMQRWRDATSQSKASLESMLPAMPVRKDPWWIRLWKWICSWIRPWIPKRLSAQTLHDQTPRRNPRSRNNSTSSSCTSLASSLDQWRLRLAQSKKELEQTCTPVPNVAFQPAFQSVLIDKYRGDFPSDAELVRYVREELSAESFLWDLHGEPLNLADECQKLCRRLLGRQGFGELTVENYQQMTEAMAEQVSVFWPECPYENQHLLLFHPADLPVHLEDFESYGVSENEITLIKLFHLSEVSHVYDPAAVA